MVVGKTLLSPDHAVNYLHQSVHLYGAKGRDLERLGTEGGRPTSVL